MLFQTSCVQVEVSFRSFRLDALATRVGLVSCPVPSAVPALQAQPRIRWPEDLPEASSRSVVFQEGCAESMVRQWCSVPYSEHIVDALAVLARNLQQ